VRQRHACRRAACARDAHAIAARLRLSRREQNAMVALADVCAMSEEARRMVIEAKVLPCILAALCDANVGTSAPSALTNAPNRPQAGLSRWA
jgi:glutamine synthetase adenylyltransferase